MSACEAPTVERCGGVVLTRCRRIARHVCFGRGTAPLAKQYPTDAAALLLMEWHFPTARASDPKCKVTPCG